MAGTDSRKIWVIANWKANKTISEALDWIARVGPKLLKKDNIEMILCPSFSALSEAKKAIAAGNYPIALGAQDLSPFCKGAYTGEEPAEFLKEYVKLAILGHSERRQNFGETDEIVAQKAGQALVNNIIPLVCVQDLETKVPEGCKLVAYEPVWAIGNGNPETAQNADTVAERLKEKYGDDLAVLYGGSVGSGNIKGFLTQENLSGVLIGNASLSSEEFLKICQILDL